jgi:hypothetical protein
MTEVEIVGMRVGEKLCRHGTSKGAVKRADGRA